MALVESFSGIRGVWQKELTDRVAVRYSWAYRKQFSKEATLVIGRDTRQSGELLRLSVVEGLRAAIIDVGILPTPAIQEAVRYFKADGGIIITGSHNPKEHNGFKFLDKDGAVLRPEKIDKIIADYNKIKDLPEEVFLKKHLFSKYKESIVGKHHNEAREQYVAFLKDIVGKVGKPNEQIIFDINGGAGGVIKDLCKEIGIKATYLGEKEGTFLHEIEPSEKTLKSHKLKEEDILFAFDCDADRVEVMTKQGHVDGNALLALLVDDLLNKEQHPEQQSIVVNDATSWLVKHVVEKYRAAWMEVEVGEINVVDAMIGADSPIGGEGSNGGVIIPPSRCRDGLLTSMLLIRMLADKNVSLRSLLEELPTRYTIKKKRKGSIKRKQIIDTFTSHGFTVQTTGDETGGIKAIDEDHWVWLRGSKTEHGIIRIIADAKDKTKAQALVAVAEALL